MVNEEKYLKLIKEAENAQKIGDYKTVNKVYIAKHKLRNKMILDMDNYNSFFINLLNNDSSYVVLDAAIALLKTNERLAIESLEKLSKQKSIDGFTAKMTLQEWKKGNMK